MNTKFSQNLTNKISDGAYDLALNTTEKAARVFCLFFILYEPEFIDEMLEEE